MVRGWRGFLLHLLEGLLSIVVGAVLLADPLIGAMWLTLLIGVFLVIGGVLRGVLAFQLRQTRRVGMAAGERRPGTAFSA